MSARLWYACDACGHVFEHETASMLECPKCEAPRLWEFEREQPAREHGAHIEAIARSVQA